MNTDKVIGNFLVAGATALTAALAIGAQEAFLIAAINAVLIGLAAAGKELCEEGEKIPKKIRPAICKLTNAAVLI